MCISNLGRTWSLIGALFIGLIGGWLTPALAAMPAPCSEEILEFVEVASAGGQHTIGCDGTVLLRQTLVISNDVTLDASGHGFAIDGDRQHRLFHVLPGASLTLIHLTLMNGFSREGGASVAAP